MSKNTKDTSDQSQRFIETARALECDEDEAAFKAKLATIARQRLRGTTDAATVARTASDLPFEDKFTGNLERKLATGALTEKTATLVRAELDRRGAIARQKPKDEAKKTKG